MRFNQIGIPILLILFLHPLSAVSQSPPPAPGSDSSTADPNSLTGNFSPSMGVIVIVLIAALFFMGFFSIYVRHCSDDDSPSVTRRLSAAQTGRSRRNAPRGLDSSVIDSFPTFDYSDVKSLKIGKGALECAVCLNEFEDDETLRLIPKCDHVFHPECIDAWLAAHTTCPVCRANLVPTGESVHAPELGQINEAHQGHDDEDGEDQINQNDDFAIDIAVGQHIGSPTGPESMEQPLNVGLTPPLPPKLSRNRTRRNVSGRPRWFGKYSRSNSTGHVAVKQWENMERFTLRLPDDVRRQIMSGKLNRTTSLLVLPRDGSSRRGNRAWAGPGEGSSRGRVFGSGRFDRTGRSDRWVFSLMPPFFSRALSMRSPKGTTASAGGSVRSNKAADNAVDTVSELKLPPV